MAEKISWDQAEVNARLVSIYGPKARKVDTIEVNGNRAVAFYQIRPSDYTDSLRPQRALISAVLPVNKQSLPVSCYFVSLLVNPQRHVGAVAQHFFTSHYAYCLRLIIING